MGIVFFSSEFVYRNLRNQFAMLHEDAQAATRGCSSASIAGALYLIERAVPSPSSISYASH
jgi:hypothetical protein